MGVAGGAQRTTVAGRVPVGAGEFLAVAEAAAHLLVEHVRQLEHQLAWVAQTRRGHGYTRKPDDTISYVIDFEGPALRKLSPEAAVEAVFTVDGNAELVESNTYRNEVTGGWRATMRVRRIDEKKPVELRAFLRMANTTLSETWSSVIPPV